MSDFMFRLVDDNGDYAHARRLFTRACDLKNHVNHHYREYNNRINVRVERVDLATGVKAYWPLKEFMERRPAKRTNDATKLYKVFDTRLRGYVSSERGCTHVVSGLSNGRILRSPRQVMDLIRRTGSPETFMRVAVFSTQNDSPGAMTVDEFVKWAKVDR
jgi:hypothetical protein